MENESPKKSSPRLKDVARKAGVSETTASMVFSGRGRISEETKNMVLHAAEALGYVHQQREKRSKGKGNCVGILLITDRESSFLWHFLSEMLNQIEADLDHSGLKPVVIPISIHEEDELIYQKITSLGCRAVFSVHAGKDQLFKRLEKEGIPLIVILNNNFKDNCFSICVDNFLVGYEGTRHLLSLGHRRINFVDDYREDLPRLSEDRYYGYKKALEEQNIPFREEYKFNCEKAPTKEAIEEKLKGMLEGADPPTAFFCLDDEIAFRIWFALDELGYKIPEDFSIIAPGDVLDYSKPYVPPVTTMQINMKDMGKLAVNMLENRMNSGLDTHQVLYVRAELQERGSCSPY
ncbi:MAG: LacI family DNA-binding transcriptional regulator [Spirochaetales bacterium]|nr:LacI family DNA-binding transcriptional regulator [Spirochaetales bacterium]